MLAVEVHRTAAFTVEVGEPIAGELELDIDAVFVRSATPHFGAKMRQVIADFQFLDPSLRLIDVGLLESRTAEKAVQVFALQ